MWVQLKKTIKDGHEHDTGVLASSEIQTEVWVMIKWVRLAEKRRPKAGRRVAGYLVVRKNCSE